MSMDPQAEMASGSASVPTSGDGNSPANEGKRRRRRNRRSGRKSATEATAKVSDDAATVAANGGKQKIQGNREAPGGRQAGNTSKKNQPTPQRRPRTHADRGGQARAIYSAIDLGTNNCRLLIARPTRGGFRVIDAFSRIVRLGEGISANSRLSDEAMDRTIDALKVCAEKIARRGVTCMRHVATEACRVADNSEEFVARVKRETGINLDVISAGEEARLAVMGCQSLIAPGNRNALVFDIGGGSTELIWVRVHQGQRTEISGWMSIPWGVVNLSEKFGVTGDSLHIDRYEEMVALVVGHLQAFEDAHQVSEIVRRKKTQFLGTSGTVTTLASLHLNLPRYVREKVDGAWMKSQDIHRLSRQVASMTHKERAAQPCIGPERADLVVAGCAILEGILGMWKVPSLRVADRGIREGILRGMMQMDQPPQPGGARRKRGGKGRSRASQQEPQSRGGQNQRQQKVKQDG